MGIGRGGVFVVAPRVRWTRPLLWPGTTRGRPDGKHTAAPVVWGGLCVARVLDKGTSCTGLARVRATLGDPYFD